MKPSIRWLLVLALCVSGCAQEGNETNTPPVTDPSASLPETSLPESLEVPVEKVENAIDAVLGNPLDLTYVSADFSSAVILHPARFLNSPLMTSLRDAGLPIDEPIQEMIDNTGLDPRTIEQVIVLLDNETASMAPMLLPGGAGGGAGGFDDDPGFPEEKIPEVKDDTSDEERKVEDAVPERKADEFGARAKANALQPVNTFVQPGDVDDFGGPPEPPFPTVIVRFTKDVDQEALFSSFPPLEEKEIDGVKVKAIPDPNVDGVFHFPNARTMIATPSSRLKSVLAAKNVDSKLTKQLKAIDASNDLIVVADLEPFAPMLQQAAGMLAFFLPPQLEGLQTVPTQVSSLALMLGVSGENLLQIQLTMKSSEQAAQAGGVFSKLIDQAKAQFNQSREQLLTAPIPVAEENREAIVSMIDEMVAGISSDVSAPTVTLKIKQPENFVKIVEYLKPAIEEAKQAGERQKKMNNLKQIALAFHIYHDLNEKFPGAGSDASGEHKGLSWRVHLLPFLERQDLYEQFHLDEPWDSDHNKKLIAQMPEIYQVEGVEEEGQTSLHVFVGEQAFSNDEGLGFVDVRDGTSNTLLVVQAGADRSDVWTKPGGLTPNTDDPISVLGRLPDEGFLAAMMDGSVRFISSAIAPETLKALITKAGGEVVNFDEF